MYCKHCMKMIDDDAIFCPACGKSQQKPVKKPIYKRWWFWVIAVILVIGFTGGSNEPEIVSSNGGSVQQVAGQTQFAIGDTATLNNVFVTFEDVTESRGSEFIEPADGNVFLLCEFTIENHTDSELNISSLVCFNAYVDDYTTGLSFSAESSTNKNALDGTIAPGKKMNGIIGYEVPRNWKTLEIHFTPDFWSSNENFVFVCNK